MHTGCVQIDCTKYGCISYRSVIDINDFMFFLCIALILFGQHKHITITALMVVGQHKHIAIKILLMCGVWNIGKCTWEYVIHTCNESITV